jgi:hypothetical protein
LHIIPFYATADYPAVVRSSVKTAKSRPAKWLTNGQHGFLLEAALFLDNLLRNKQQNHAKRWGQVPCFMINHLV